MPSHPAASRWTQLLLGLVVMMAISSPQYVWTLFVKPFQATTGAGLPTVQITFSVLIVLQTLFSPAQGWVVDRFGPKTLIAVGAALTGLGWVLSAYVDTVWMLFLTYGLFCGIGTGIVYVGVIGLMARWFPDRRGFAIGIVAAGYGMGAMLTTFPSPPCSPHPARRGLWSCSASFSAASASLPRSACASLDRKKLPLQPRRMRAGKTSRPPKC